MLQATVVRWLLFSLCCFSLSTIGYAQSSIGVAKNADITGRGITYTYVIENLGTGSLDSIALADDLDAVFGAGNYSITSNVALIGGDGNVTANASFDGSTDTSLVSSGGILTSGQSVTFELTVEVTTLSDQGNGFGVYSNQVTVQSLDSGPSVVSDLSDFGTDPDPDGNGDAGDAGEDDPTIVSLVDSPKIAIAKNASLVGTQVTFDFYIENQGNDTLSSVSIPDDLDAVFGAGNYTITTPPASVSGSLVGNSLFNGSSDIDIIDSGTIAIGETAQVQMVVNITNVTDQGNGTGVYENQVTVSALSPVGNLTTDISTNGTDPDPGGLGNPGREGNNEPTPIVIGEEPFIGLAIDAQVTNSTVLFDVIVENLGNTSLQNLTLPIGLDDVFGAGNWFINTAPSLLIDPGGVTLNPDFDANFDTDLFVPSTSTLPATQTARVQFNVTVVEVSDQGSGLGNYTLSTTASGEAPGGTFAEDVSDFGTNPDPNDNGDAGDVDEDDPTTFTVASIASLGISVAYQDGGSSGSPNVELVYTITNYGNQEITNITVDHDLNTVYGAGNYIHTQDPTFTGGATTLNYNSAFNGNSNTALLTGGSSLAAGESVSFAIKSLIANVTDQGFGVGIFQTNVTVLGTDPAASPVSDTSTQGSDPDPDGNGNPDENDPTVIDTTGTTALGVALDANVSGNQITLDLYFENLGTVNFSNLDLDLILEDAFGEGNYFIQTAPSFVDDPGTITLDFGYDGNTDITLLDVQNSSLVAGDTAQIQFVVEVSRVQNIQGLGLGNYSIQATLGGLSDLGLNYSDTSDFGTDPDPSGNNDPTEAGEEDATTFSIAADSPIGAALDAAVAGFDVTFDVYLENLGASTLSSTSAILDLDAVFGVGNYSITTPPSLITDPGTLTLSGSFDGSENNDLLSSVSTLNGAATAQIQLVVEVTTESDQGNGAGIYSAQVTAVGTVPAGVELADLSDDSTDPDPNGNNDPGEAGEEDPTSIVIIGNPAIGTAMTMSVSGTEVTYDLYVENLGDTTLSNVLAENPLNPIYGSGNFSVTSQPSLISGPGTLSLSGQYFGFSVFTFVIAGGTLAPGEVEHIRFVVNVTNVTDQGNGLGVYIDQIDVTANDPGGNPFNDLTDDGNVPDSNGNGAANDAGEDDTSTAVIGEEGLIGVALDTSVSGTQVTFTYTLETFGNSAISNLSLPHDLDAVFGAGNYSITTGPTFVDDPGAFSLNGSFDGSATTELISGSLTMPTPDTASFTVVVDVTTISDVGTGLGNYTTQVEVTGDKPTSGSVSDLSDSGTNPDPSDNDIPNDGNEADPTAFTVEFTSLGVALDATANGNLVTLDYFIANLGLTDFSTITIAHDLDAVFGAGNYVIDTAPTIVGAQRDIVTNTSFNGSSDTAIISSGGIPAGPVEQIQLIVEVTTLADLGSGLGNYSTQVTVIGDSSETDLSDSGTDPDPDGDSDADEAGENDATTFSVAEEPVIGLALDASTSGNVVTFNYYVEAFGNTDLSNVTVTHDLDALFGAGNYSVTAAPSLVDDPGTVTLNAGFNGSGQTGLLSSGTLAQFDTAQIQVEVTLTSLVDNGSGFGVYSANATAAAQSADATATNDTSTDGSDPDTDADNDPAENTTTDFTITQDPVIGLALSSSVTDSVVTLDYYLEAFGNVGLSNVTLTQDLVAQFGAGNYTVSSAPSFVDDPGTITLNAGFDGNGTTGLISSGTLAQFDTAQIRIEVTVATLVDNGGGLGSYALSATATAESPDSTATNDTSDNGTDPDPNGNGNPDEAGENDNTSFSIAEIPVIGLALNDTVSGSTVTFDYYLEAFGNVATLSSVTLTHSLDNIFGAGTYSVTAAPSFIDNPGSITLNPAFNGSSDLQLISSGSLAQFDTAQIRIQVTVNQLTDQGSGLGVYGSTSEVTARSPDSTAAVDSSDDGTDPDPNGNGNPDEAGENNATAFTIAQDPVIGIALDTSVSGSVVTLNYYLEAFGNTDLESVTVSHDLDAAFGAGNYTVSTAPSFIDDPGTLTANAGFDGSASANVINAGTLALGDTAQVQLQVTIDNVTDQGGGLGIYTTNAAASAQSLDSTATNDNSDAGTDADPNGNGDPTEAGENDPTSITVSEDAVIGIAQDVSVSTYDVTFTLYLENLGNVEVDTFTLSKDLNALFGTDNYSVSTSLAFSDDPGTLTLNPGFDGDADTSILSAGSLASGDTAAITFTVSLTFIQDNGSGNGNFSDNTSVQAQGIGGTATSDTSTFGTDADPNGNGDPTEVGEDAPTTFNVDDSSIGDFVFNDLDGDGIFDGGEPGISGVRIYIDANSNSIFDTGEISGQTSGSGAYGIDGLIAGTYTIRIDASSLPPDSVFTFGNDPDTIVLAVGENYAQADYGFQTQNASIAGLVWDDLNGDGIRDAGEPGLEDVIVFIDFNNNGVFNAEDILSTTIADGTYIFNSLAAGTYNLRVLASSLPEGYILTGGVEPLQVTLVDEEEFTGGDFGFQQQNGFIGDFVWDDQDRDGVQDAGEPGLAGVTVFLDDNANSVLDAGEPSDVTDGNGSYGFSALPAGTYSVTIDESTLPTNFIESLNTENPLSVVLAEGENNTNADFGYRERGAEFGGTLFNDLDGNGVQDAGDPGIQGVTVFLDDNSNGSLDGGEESTTTQASGLYAFEDIPAGTYTIAVDEATLSGNFVLTSGSNPRVVTVAAAESNFTFDVGYQQRDASIAGQVWDDANGNNTLDPGETLLTGVVIFLDLNGNATLDIGEDSIATDASGEYLFAGLAANTYAVALDESTAPANFGVTFPGNPQSVTVAADEEATNINFALQEGSGIIAGTFFIDTNRNQALDGGEAPLANVTLNLLRNGNVGTRGANVVVTATTDANGEFSFENLIQGEYQIEISDQNSVLTDLELTAAASITQVSLNVGQVIDNLEFGYCAIPTVSEQTENQSLCIGDTLELSVEASGTGDLSYQWQKDGTDINGATSATYEVNFVEEEDSGLYVCVISNDCGEIDSQTIEVEVFQLGAEFASPIQAQGIVPVTLEADIFCAFQEFSFFWTNLNTSSDFGTDQNPVTLDAVLTETTTFQFTLTDDIHDPSTPTQTVLVSEDPFFLDLNGDGCNNMDDMREMRALWPMPMDDPDGSGRISILDFFYINTENVGSCPTP